MNLIKNLVKKDEEPLCVDNLVETVSTTTTPSKIPQYNKVSFYVKKVSILLVLLILSTSIFLIKGKNQKAEALPFGLENDYLEIIEMNKQFANTVPVPIESIKTTETQGDARVLALYSFFVKNQSPFATMSIAKAFVKGAEDNGFTDKWYVLPAIAGIESGFGRRIPIPGGKSSHNAWGWSGGCSWAKSRWSCFNSWEEAIAAVSRGMAKGYGATNMDPNKMMRTWCPPCALDGGGLWAKHVNGYIGEINAIYKSI